MTPTVEQAIQRTAAKLGWPARALGAVIEVESGGNVFTTINGHQMPLILFEPHVFYRCLPDNLKQEAVAAGLAYRKWGTKPYPKAQADRYRQLERAKDIHEEAAYMACSWGVGQVLGENAAWLGYTSARQLAETTMKGIDGQIAVMARFIQKRGLGDELVRRDWRGFARAYNGPGQVDYYASLMSAAYRRLGGVETEQADGILSMGVRGPAVTALQIDLRRLGFSLEADGDFGPATKATVITFQQQQKLIADGIVGPKTQGRIEALLPKPAPSVPVIDAHPATPAAPSFWSRILTILGIRP